MTVRRWFGLMLGMAGLAVLVAHAPVLGGADDKVVWKAFDYNKDNPNGFYQTLTTKTTQTMKVSGQELKQEQEQTFYIQWVPQEKKDADGNWVVKQKIIGVKMKIDIGGNKIEYESITKDQPQNPLSDFFQKLMKLELTFTITPKLTVKKVDGRDDFIKELGKVAPQMQPLLEKILSEKALIAMADPTWAPFPEGGNMKAKSWDKSSTLDLGPIGVYDTKFTYTPDGKKDKLDKISVKSTLTYTKPAKAEGLPFVIKEGKLTGTDGKGEVLFNRDKGRFDSSSMDMNLTGELKIAVGGMDTEVTLTQHQTASSKSDDADPVEAERAKLKAK